MQCISLTVSDGYNGVNDSSEFSVVLTVTGSQLPTRSRGDEDTTEDCFNLLPQSAVILQQSIFFNCSDQMTVQFKTQSRTLRASHFHITAQNIGCSIYYILLDLFLVPSNYLPLLILTHIQFGVSSARAIPCWIVLSLGYSCRFIGIVGQLDTSQVNTRSILPLCAVVTTDTL